MLNRRYLRIKAMQAVYAYRRKEEANVLLALDHIEELFEPDYAAVEAPDYERLKENSKKAKALFRKGYATGTLSEESEPEVRDAVQEGFRYYKEENSDECRSTKQEMLRDADRILDRQYNVLLMLAEMADLSHLQFERKQQRQYVTPEMNLVGEQNLHNNILIQAMRNHSTFQTEVSRRSLYSEKDEAIAKKLFTTILPEDETYRKYISKEQPSFEEDREMIIHIIRDIIFRNEEALALFEEQDIHWQENRDIVRSLCLKPFKKADEEEGITFFAISEDWEEDKKFFETLFDATLALDRELKEFLQGKIRNWDVERISTVDRTIMEMALAEMTTFPNIPVKVTLNEYIDMAKRFSTPKSKQFVNGVLDAASKELKDTGKIRKSGRGLLDNQ